MSKINEALKNLGPAKEVTLENGIYMDGYGDVALLNGDSLTVPTDADPVEVSLLGLSLHKYINTLIDLSNSTYLGPL